MTIPSRSRKEVVAATLEMTVQQAARLMCEKHIGALIVLVDERIVGILSERDLARDVVSQNRDPVTTRVEQIMKSPVISVTEDQSVRDVMALMRTHHIRHVPLVDSENRPLAMLSIRDMLKARVRALVDENRSLAAFLMADGPGG